MRTAISLMTLLAAVSAALGQNYNTRVFETEKAFEAMAAEKGINAAFIEYLAPVSTVFLPDAVNGREAWRARPASGAALTWNPIWIDSSSNGVLAYSIGNSRYMPKGKGDAQVYYGHYITVWLRQPNGEYRAVLDGGINHDNPTAEPVSWKSPSDTGRETNPDKISAADSAVGFYEMSASSGAGKAYRAYLAEDAVLMREERLPAFGRKAALSLIDGDTVIAFAKRKSFTEAAELAYVNSRYTITRKGGEIVERGNFVQVWKLRGRKWVIVADVFLPLPAKS